MKYVGIDVDKKMCQAAVRDDPRFQGLYEHVSRRRDAGCAVVAVAHEMARIMYFMLSRGEPYRDANGGLVERKLKNMSKRAYDGLWNKVDAAQASELLKRFS